jgi:ATP-binding cassette subfamily C protein CydD
VGSSFHASIEGATAARQALDLLDEGAVPSGPHPAAPVAAQGRPDVFPLFPLRLEEVTFGWPRRARPVLAGVDLTLGPGEHVAVVGESGAGKSTLLGLLLGFVAPDRGRITAAGVDLEAIGLDRWRTQVSWVPQRPHLFAASIADNIRLGRRDASDDAVRAAAARANALGFIDRLPDGLQTPIGDGGVPLSGGEVQRIALARAFLRDAPLVLLDEPTASLDAANQDTIVEALDRLLESRAAIVVTHRAAPVRLAGRVLTLDGGRLTERPAAAPSAVPSPALR